MQEFIDSLQLPFTGGMVDNKYKIDLFTSNDFSKVFTKISTNENLDVVDEGSLANDKFSKFSYTDGYYEVTLIANYERDIYAVEITER